MSRSVFTLAALAGLCLLVFSPAAFAERPFTWNATDVAASSVDIEAVSGSITVTGWDRDEIDISGTLGDRVEDVAVEVDGDEVTIEVKLEKKSKGKKWQGYDARLEIRLPAGVDLDIETVSADQSVDGIRGALDLAAVSGELRIGGEPASADLSAVSGNIEFRGRTGEIDAESVSGDIRMSGVWGEVDVESVSGDTSIEAGVVDEGSVESVSGDVSFAGEVSSSGELDIESHSGTVSLTLPGGASGNIEAETYSGSIASDFGEPVRGERSGEYLEYSGGGGSVDVETFSGSIEIRG